MLFRSKDGGLRIVHDLQKLNSVTIRDSAVPPIIEEFVKAYAGQSVYTVLDMYWGSHARMLDVESVRVFCHYPINPGRLSNQCQQVHTNTPQVVVGIEEPWTLRLTARTLSY